MNKFWMALRQSQYRIILLFFVFILAAIYFSYTRASIGTVAYVIWQTKKYNIKEITTKDGLRFVVYKNKNDLKIYSLDQLKKIIEKAQKDFPFFMKKYYPSNARSISPHLRDIISIIIIDDDKIYNYFDRIFSKNQGQHDSIVMGIYSKYFKAILLRANSDEYDVEFNEQIVRHEVFHCLAGSVYLIRFTAEEDEEAAMKFEYFHLPLPLPLPFKK